MNLFKLERNHIHVDIVKNHLGMKVTGKYMKEFTLMRNHIHVNIVKNPFLTHVTGINMNEFTPLRNHIIENIVTQSSNNSFLSIQLVMHTGVKMFSCSFCDKKLTRQGKLIGRNIRKTSTLLVSELQYNSGG